ncbi:MAG: beta-N-acetylglucosaminidase domain-containing protein [Clostridia bacterium]|nr:beta-N-acetylglucosaminidase domain-containing protein [Clostridia bacterium]
MPAFIVMIGILVLCLTACTREQPPSENPPNDTETFLESEDTGAPDIETETESDTEDPVDTEDITQPDQTFPGVEAEMDIYPQPMDIAIAEGRQSKTVKLDDKAAKYANLLTEAGFTVSEDGAPLTVTLRDLNADFEYGTDEAYILKVTGNEILIEAQTDRGAHYAIMTLAQLAQRNEDLPIVIIKDAPRNAIRGVIEGFYGTAWTHQYRKDLFAFMGQNKMNTYIYAPKDDAKHRAQWRVLYTGTELERMTDLIQTANEHYVKFVYALSPGGDINLGNGYEADFEKLMAKCQQMYDLGVRDFAIFLDDIPTLDAKGHGKLLSDFQTRFVMTHEGVSDLIAITTEYGDPFLTKYTDEIAPLIHEDVVLMWTGPGVIPESITNQSLKHIIKTYNRNVLIWWNYPVNDTLANHLFMGPCVNLETELYKSITGLTANPMNQGYASMVPLFTTGDYLWNPEAYDPQASLAAACKSLMPDASEALGAFISMTCASGINKNTDSEQLQTLLGAFKKNNSAETRAALRSYFESMVRNADTILASDNQLLVSEINDWLTKYRVYGQMGVLYIEMEDAYAAGKDSDTMLSLLGEYKTLERCIAKNPQLVSASVLTTFYATLNSRFSQLLGQAEGLSYAPATPYTNCNHYENYTPNLMTDGDDSTFFWTHGDLNTAAGNKTGYFGVDLGAVIDIHNVYIATGVAGSDALGKGIVEYSADAESWTTLYEGSCADAVVIRDLAVKARYVRVRNADKSDGTWTKICAFEVNTNRTVLSDAPAGVPTLTTSLPTYSTYFPEFMTDGDPNTYFWSSRGAQAGDSFEIDLGTVTAVSHITFKTGVPDHAADYVQSGELCYSADGQSWVKLCAINQRDTELDVDIKARYIRVIVTKDQTNWVTVSEFTALSEDHVSPLLQLDANFVPRTDLLSLTDGLYVTFFAPDEQKASGHSLDVTVSESGSVKLIALCLPQNGLSVTVLDASGREIQTVELSYATEVQAPKGSIIRIPLGNGLILTEVEW